MEGRFTGSTAEAGFCMSLRLFGTETVVVIFGDANKPAVGCGPIALNSRSWGSPGFPWNANANLHP